MNCPQCHKPVQEDWKACPYCQSTLTIVCTNCNQDLQGDWKACPFCGTTVKNANTEEVSHNNSVLGYCTGSGSVINHNDKHFKCMECGNLFLENYRFEDKPVCQSCAYDSGMAQLLEKEREEARRIENEKQHKQMQEIDKKRRIEADNKLKIQQEQILQEEKDNNDKREAHKHLLIKQEKRTITAQCWIDCSTQWMNSFQNKIDANRCLREAEKIAFSIQSKKDILQMYMNMKNTSDVRRYFELIQNKHTGYNWFEGHFGAELAFYLNQYEKCKQSLINIEHNSGKTSSHTLFFLLKVWKLLNNNIEANRIIKKIENIPLNSKESSFLARLAFDVGKNELFEKCILSADKKKDDEESEFNSRVYNYLALATTYNYIGRKNNEIMFEAEKIVKNSNNNSFEIDINLLLKCALTWMEQHEIENASRCLEIAYSRNPKIDIILCEFTKISIKLDNINNVNHIVDKYFKKSTSEGAATYQLYHIEEVIRNTGNRSLYEKYLYNSIAGFKTDFKRQIHNIILGSKLFLNLGEIIEATSIAKYIEENLGDLDTSNYYMIEGLPKLWQDLHESEKAKYWEQKIENYKKGLLG